MTKKQQTLDEYLLSQLDMPVTLKDGSTATKADGTPMTKEEAIATNILNKAMKGDLSAAQYIINLQKQKRINRA